LHHEFDISPFPARRHLIDDLIQQWGIGPGDDVLLPGLFWHHAGETKNAPIIRIGNIAAMPGDKVYTRDYGRLDAYLIEVRSVGGLSGSPVFFNGQGGTRNIKVQAATLTGRPLPHFVEKTVVMGAGYFLLGLVHGHYYEHTQRVDVVEDVINSGIAIVTPADKILELILDPQEVARRKEKYDKERQERGSSTADRVRPLTDDEFQRALERVSRRGARDPRVPSKRRSAEPS
jgi:hypothetical protein